MKILVAEDHGPSRRLLRAMLEGLGYQTVLAEDGEQAWTHLTVERFRIVISDWMMPGLSGVELCRRLRARDSAAGTYTYVILVTAKSAKSDYREAMEAGVDDFLTKPFEPEYLESRIRVAQRIVGLKREVLQLEGLLSICSYCKKIRDGAEHWIPIETYVRDRTAAEFSHGYCPACYRDRVEPQFGRVGDVVP